MSLWSIVVLAFVPAPALAAPVAGRLSVTGSLMLTATTIDFLPAGGGIGTFSVESFAQTGSFVGLGGTTGTIKDLASAPGSVSLANFLTLAANPLTSFTLTSVDAGLFGPVSCFAPPAPGQTCTLPGSAFNLANTGVGSTLSFTLRGNVLNGADTSPFVGTVTTQFSGLPYQSILATLAGGGSVSAAYSADFRAVPSGTGADLAISKTDGVQNVQPGGTTVYTIVVTNNGPNSATSVPITDTFPATVTSVSWTCSASFGSCGAASGTGDIATTISLSPGGTATFLATATLSLAAVGTLTNTANVAEDANAPDPDLSNNSASDIDILGALGATKAPALAPAGMLALVLALLAVAFSALRRRAL